jgi:hypothetical protein
MVKLLQLQTTLYKALKDGENDLRIRKIHNDMLTSFSVRALAVRKVTANKGGKTAGTDGKT